MYGSIYKDNDLNKSTYHVPYLSYPFYYQVQVNDTIEKIAKKTNTNIETIIHLNKNKNKSKNQSFDNNIDLYPGQLLIIDEPDTIYLPPLPELIDKGWGQMHIVRSNDTLESIAIEYNTTIEDIRVTNRNYFPVGEKGILFPSQMLFIRRMNTISNDLIHKNIKKLCNKTNRYLLHHIMKKGENLYDILNKYNMTFNEFMYYNRTYFPVGKRIQCIPGNKVIVFDTKNKIINKENTNTNKNTNISEIIITKQIHEVQKGDTPDSISLLYNMTLDELRELNRTFFPKGYHGHICIGDKLIVKKGS